MYSLFSCSQVQQQIVDYENSLAPPPPPPPPPPKKETSKRISKTCFAKMFSTSSFIQR